MENLTLDRVETLDEPIIVKLDKLFGIPEWPTKVVILYYDSLAKYLCTRNENVLGLSVFSSEYYATRFLEHRADLPQLEFQEVEFEQARLLVKAYAPEMNALHIMDDPEKPQTHFVN